MTTETIDFGSNEVYPTKFVHTFAGYDTIIETEMQNN